MLRVLLHFNICCFTFLPHQSLYNVAVTTLTLLKHGVDTGNGGTADGDLLLNHAVSGTIEQQFGHPQAARKGDHLLIGEHILKQIVAVIQIFHRQKSLKQGIHFLVAILFQLRHVGFLLQL